MDQKQAAINTRDLTLTAEPLANAVVKWDRKQSPSFQIALYDNNFIIKVYTNTTDDTKNKGVIESPRLNVVQMMSIVEAVRHTIENPDMQEAFKIEFKEHFFGPEGRSKEKIVMGTVYIGREKDTREIYIALIGHKTRPKVRFMMRPPVDQNFMLGDVPMDPKMVSELWAKAWVTSLTKIAMSSYERNHQTWQQIKERKDAAKQARGGHGGGGYNNQSSPQVTPQTNNDSELW